MPVKVRRYGRVVIDPEIQAGIPVIEGTRLTVCAVLAHLAEGLTVESVINDFPYLDRADVIDAIRFGAVLSDQRNPRVLGIWDFESE